MSSNIEVKLDVLNQKASPALYAAPLANRPAASFTGRLFVDSDSPSTGIYRDTGSTWVQVADQGAGTTGTLQQVTTNGSSTTIGISTSGNGIGIGTTIPATNRLDIHSASGINATFNGTGVTNAALQFQLAGTGKWNIGNLYNSSANDFIITDVTNTLNRVTVKNTGQTFIGADTTSSGLFVVNSASSDSHIVVLGANSPSIRIRDSGSSLVQNVGIGISTALNAFIQGSASGNYCLFNSSTTASPILFGIYDAGTGNTQEAVRISAARNFLIGTTTDNGNKFQVNGNAFINGDLYLNTSYALVFTSATTQIRENSGSLIFRTGSVDRLTITSGGTSTFASVLTVTNANINLSNAYYLAGRNAANTTNIGIIGRNASDQVSIDADGYGVVMGNTLTISGILAIGNTVTAAIAAPSTHKIAIKVGGVQYYLLASNV